MDSVSILCCNCNQIVVPPIKQCADKHTICGKCVRQMSNCPKCFALFYAITYDELENIISQLNEEKLTVSCKYENKGCTYIIKQNKKTSHEAECKFRTFQCEGRKFCGWNCNWTGQYDQILSHFRHFHNSGDMKAKMEREIKINFELSTVSLEPIDYYDGQALFWYKHKVDVSKKMVYWLFQYVGLSKDAPQYYYEFDLFDGSIRKVKVMELCECDCLEEELIFKSGKCIALPFSTVKSYLNPKGYLTFRFRIIKMKRIGTDASTTEEPVSSKNPVSHKPNYKR